MQLMTKKAIFQHCNFLYFALNNTFTSQHENLLFFQLILTVLKEYLLISININIVMNNKYQTIVSDDINDSELKTEIEGFLKESFREHDVHELLDAISSNSIARRHWGVIGLRKLYQTKVNILIRRQSMDLMNSIMLRNMNQTNYPLLQLQSARIIAYYLRQDAEIKIDRLVKLSGIIVFLQMLKSMNHSEVISQFVLQFLELIVNKRKQFRNLIVIREGIPILVNFIKHQKSKKIIVRCSKILLHIGYDYVEKQEQPLLVTILQTISKLIMEEKIIDNKIITRFIELSLQSLENFPKTQRIVNRNLVIKIFSLISYAQDYLIISFLKILCQMSKPILFDGLLVDTMQHIEIFVSHDNDQVRLCAYKFLVGLAQQEGSARFIASSVKLLQSAAQSLQTDQNEDVRFLIISLLAILSKVSEQKWYLVFIHTSKVVSNVLKILQNTQRSTGFIGDILSDLYTILIYSLKDQRGCDEFREAGGVELMQSLETKNEKITNFTYMIRSII